MIGQNDLSKENKSPEKADSQLTRFLDTDASKSILVKGAEDVPALLLKLPQPACPPPLVQVPLPGPPRPYPVPLPGPGGPPPSNS